MYDTGKVIAGILVFLVFFTSPFWLNGMEKGLEGAPELELPKLEKYCVEPAAWMRQNHMQLLNDWRHEVVRSDERQYVSEHQDDRDGKRLRYDKSLSRTCLDCHSNKKKFCDRCHTYAGVKPFCWSCHVIPEEKL